MTRARRQQRRRQFETQFVEVISWMGIALVVVFILAFLVLLVRHNIGLLAR